MKKNTLISILLIISTQIFCQQKFNGMISTYADTTADGYNGILETNFYDQKNYNGIYTTFADSVGNKNFNGIIETYAANAPIKTKIASIYYNFNKTEADTREILRAIKNFPISYTIIVEGYADSKGSSSANKNVSALRAKKMAYILQKLGYTCKYEGKGTDFSTADDIARRCDIYMIF